jgi:polyisoprenoid-binding protein YceI
VEKVRTTRRARDGSVRFDVCSVCAAQSSASSRLRYRANRQSDKIPRQIIDNDCGQFDKWDASLRFQSPDETSGTLEIKIDAASVDTGSGMKNSTLKSKDFFDAAQNPYITFKSTKIVPTGPHTYEVDGDLTIRGATNPEKLTLTISGKGTGSGEIHGAMVFNRKNYGMNKGIPFIKIADHVDVSLHLKWKHTGGPPMA